MAPHSRSAYEGYRMVVPDDQPVAGPPRTLRKNRNATILRKYEESPCIKNPGAGIGNAAGEETQHVLLAPVRYVADHPAPFNQKKYPKPMP